MSPRRIILGAILIAAFSSLITYGFVSFGHRKTINSLVTRQENLATMRELAGNEAFDRFVYVLSLARRNYVQEPDLNKLLLGAADGAVAALNDPYSSFFSAKEFQHFTDETNTHYEGIGVQVTDQGKFVVVVTPFPGSPGATTPFEGAGPDDPKGLKPKDKIIKVDGRDVVGRDVNQVVKLIRGRPGTKVTLTILRAEDGGPDRQLVFKIPRARILTPSTTSRPLEPGVGYLQISQFLENTGQQVKGELQKLQEQGIKGLILDLRHNPGGRLEASVEVAELFVPKGPVVHVVDRGGRRETYTSSNPQGLGMLLVVLVDDATASAAEILAGAIQDRKAGILVGETTFGKGLVQQVWDLGDGTGLKLTVYKYLTPNGRDINRRVVDADTGAEKGGLTPNIQVPRPKNFELGVLDKDPQLQTALKELERRMRRSARER